jgi:hypothetical protein
MPMAGSTHPYPGVVRGERREITIALAVLVALVGGSVRLAAASPPHHEGASDAPAPLARPPLPSLLPAASPRIVGRRQVAVVDLVGDEDATALARALAEKLVLHDELAPVADPAIAAALIGPILEENSGSLDAARRALSDAGDALARFELEVAAARAAAGQAELNNVEPTPAAISLYADLAFVLGQAKLANGDGPAARSSFLLTQRLSPGRELDPARYLPDVIASYRQASRGGSGKLPLQIRGQGIAYVDGAEVGTAPLTIEVPAGAHVVHLFGPSRLARGARVEISPSATAVVVLPDAKAPATTVIARARRVLVGPSDAAGRSAALANLTSLVGVRDAVVISKGASGLTAQTWRLRSSGGAGRIQSVAGRESADRLLTELAPPPQVTQFFGPAITQPAESKRWYRTRWVQVSILTGTVVAIATAVAIGLRSDDGTVAVNPTPTF